MHKILNLLPVGFDHVEASLLDSSEYEVHFLYPLEDVVDKEMTSLAYGRYLKKPDFLISYVERAVDYVKKHGITAIMFSHDMATVVASVVCEQTSLPGPSLESTFLCLHKYYSRKKESGKLWYDYINMDEPSANWKGKMRYPCFLKAPFLMSSVGHSSVKNDTEMEAALDSLKKLIAPFVAGYFEFFRRYLDLKKFPLAVENITVVEELVESKYQYWFEGWVNGNGNFTMFTSSYGEISKNIAGRLLYFVIPQFISGEGDTYKKLTKYTEEIAGRFGLTNTFFNVEFWQRGDEVTMIEMNCRIASPYSAAYRKMWCISAHHAAVYLACGQSNKLMQFETPVYYKDAGEPISAQFFIFTSGEGQGKDFIDYEYARVGSIADGAYNTMGPGIAISVEEVGAVKQETTVGVSLCNFFLTDCSLSRLFEHANEVKTKLLLREEDHDLLKLPVTQ